MTRSKRDKRFLWAVPNATALPFWTNRDMASDMVKSFEAGMFILQQKYPFL